MAGVSAWLVIGGGVLGLGFAGACGGGDTNTSTTESTHETTTGQGGTTDGTGGSGGGVSAKTACTDLAKARCQRIGACSNGFQITARFGDEKSCEFRLEQACEAALLSPDSGESGADIEACAAATTKQGCIQLFANVAPTECAPKAGARAEDEACGTGSQCKSGWCELGLQSTCGNCSGVPLAGSQCGGDGDCGDGFVCFKNFCALSVAAGGACNKKTKPCLPGQSCVGATDMADGTCQKAGDMVDEACDPTTATGAGCNTSLGLYCHPSLKKCERVVLVDADQPCGVVKNHVVACKNAGRCKVAAMMNMGMCVAAAGDTMACNVQTGPSCLPPAICVTDGQSADGTCTFPDPGVCAN